jgi:hypothetical protein
MFLKVCIPAVSVAGKYLGPAWLANLKIIRQFYVDIV